MLSAQIEVIRANFHLNVDLESASGSTVAVVGPNGSGKTTLLRALAGLTAIDAGFITVDADDWERVDSKIRKPPNERSSALVLADPLLFPGKSALENIAFGRRARGDSRTHAAKTAADWLTRMGIGDLGDRTPSTLSTGQQQRVSLARAMVVEPRLLLLDEPLSAQDPLVRSELRVVLQRVLRENDGVALIVTHDPVDALTFADSLLVLESGVVTQTGTPAELTARPKSEFVAQMVGLNLLRGAADETHVTIDGGGVLTSAQPSAGRVLVAFSPHAVAISSASADADRSSQHTSSPRNVWSARVTNLQHIHGRVRVGLAGPPDLVAEITPAAAADLHLELGLPVAASLKATEIEVYPG